MQPQPAGDRQGHPCVDDFLVTRVYHFGPSTNYIGGMASAIAMLVTHNAGAETAIAVPTWVPGSHVRSGWLTARATALVLRLPPRVAIHVHMSEGGSFVRETAILAAARYRHLRRVVSIHGADFAGFSESHPRLVRATLSLASAVTVLSEADLAIVRNLAPHVAVELVPNPMPLDPLSGPVEETAELVLFAGEVGLRKGVDVLRRAWEMVSSDRPTAKCVVVGPHTDLRLRDAERMEVRGPVDPKEVRQLIRQARVVALPSRAEALPMILVEAMAAGRPFVSTPTGGTTSLAVGGLMVPVGDHQALADALIALLADRERAHDLGSAGRAYCRERFSPESVGVRLGQLYTGCQAGVVSERLGAKSTAYGE